MSLSLHFYLRRSLWFLYNRQKKEATWVSDPHTKVSLYRENSVVPNSTYYNKLQTAFNIDTRSKLEITRTQVRQPNLNFEPFQTYPPKIPNSDPVQATNPLNPGANLEKLPSDQNWIMNLPYLSQNHELWTHEMDLDPTLNRESSPRKEEEESRWHCFRYGPPFTWLIVPLAFTLMFNWRTPHT